MKRSNAGRSWQVQLQCPQCGAPAVLEECDRLLCCSYCRVNLYLTCKEHFSYFLPPGNPFRENLFFVPYWRFRGMAFSCAETAVSQRVVDASILAVPFKSFPVSLGLRPQALRLRFVTPELEWTFVPPRVAFKAFMAKLIRRIPIGGGAEARLPSFHRAFVGETVSLIYTPFYVRDHELYDAVLEEPVAPLPQEGASRLLQSVSERSATGTVGFVPTICPYCGWDLAGERDSLVCLCRNCESVWQLSADGLQKLDFAVSAGDLEAPVYLPFWKIRVRLSGIELESYADLAKLANLPHVIRDRWRREPVSFWFPAFKVNPRLFLRLGKTLTLAQPGKQLQQGLPEAADCHPVTLPVGEAVEAIKLAIAAVGVPKRLVFPRLDRIDVQLQGYSLVYIPFSAGATEFVQTELRVSINRHALQLGRLI